MSLVAKIYKLLFNWLVKNKKYKYSDEPEQLHRSLVSVLLTSVLMWSYTANSIFCIDSKLLITIALTTSLIHLLSPLTYKVTQSVYFTTNLFIGSGYVFQLTHAFYTGGFHSNSLIWLSVLPLIAGIVCGVKMLKGWSIFSIISVFLFYYFNSYTSNIITPVGKTWAQFNIGIGYIILNLVLMLIYIHYRDIKNERLSSKTESIRRLLRIVSHDISNPLTVISSSSLLIKKIATKENNEKVTKYNEKILKSMSMVQEILDDAKKFEAIDSGKQKIEISQVSLNEIVKNSIFIFREKIEHKKIELLYDFEANKNIKIRASNVAVKNQVFNNLFSNSIKFMQSNGHIKIQTKILNDKIKIFFSDTGVGIDASLIENLFRSDIATTQKGVNGEIGTGFGMPIVQKTLEAFGASISVISITKEQDEKKHGTTFTMIFNKAS